MTASLSRRENTWGRVGLEGLRGKNFSFLVDNLKKNDPNVEEVSVATDQVLAI